MVSEKYNAYIPTGLLQLVVFPIVCPVGAARKLLRIRNTTSDAEMQSTSRLGSQVDEQTTEIKHLGNTCVNE